MEPQDVPVSRFDPVHWEFRVRRSDGTWLCRPESTPDQPASNAETWSRRIRDGWSFDSMEEARKASRSHGTPDIEISVIPAPRRPGDWLAKGRTTAIAA